MSADPPPPRSLRLRRSIRKSVSMYPRSTPGTWSRIVWQLGPSDAIPVVFRKSGTVSINEPLEARRQIMNPSRSPHFLP